LKFKVSLNKKKMQIINKKKKLLICNDATDINNIDKYFFMV